MIEATELFLIDEENSRILLGHKKTGFGKGKILGIGGKLEAGEQAEDAAIREMEEETGVVVEFVELVKSAEIAFVFPHKPEQSMLVHNYIATIWQGEPQETDEIRPIWFPLNQIPYHSMWDDAKYWLPLMLNGKKIDGKFTFGPDNETVIRQEATYY